MENLFKTIELLVVKKNALESELSLHDFRSQAPGILAVTHQQISPFPAWALGIFSSAIKTY